MKPVREPEPVEEAPAPAPAAVAPVPVKQVVVIPAAAKAAPAKASPAKAAPAKITIGSAKSAVKTPVAKASNKKVEGSGLGPVVPVLAVLFGGLVLKTATADPTKRKCKVEHDVHSTDTLTHIAELHGITSDDIITRKENKNVRLQGWLKNSKQKAREGKTIYIGERLCIR